MTKPDFIYTTYIKTTAEKLWQALTTPEFTRQYWGHDNVSQWTKGSEWKHVDPENEQVKIVGMVLESDPPNRLVLSWASPNDPSDDSQVSFEIVQVEDMVRLDVVHGKFKAGSPMRENVSAGWPRVLSSLKSFLESGQGINVWAGYEKDCGSVRKAS
ncbi:MAG: SRPBCC family protein [Alphaproteobacteria bacterium]|nr:SRPBCC family protein [Alphaproteobacteria bacterium]